MKSIVSSRIPVDGSLIHSIKEVYGGVFSSISVVFGFTEERSRLYGGRKSGYGATKKDLSELYDHGIGFDVVMTNHHFNEEAYQESQSLLQGIHRKGNGVVCTNDELAMRIKEDFPELTLRASMIKHCDTAEKVEKALELYDYVTLPVYLSDKEVLNEIKQKDRVIVFANAACAYYCKSHPCYHGVSDWLMTGKKNNKGTCEYKTIKKIYGHRDKMYQEFDLSNQLYEGYEWFKWVPRRG